MSQELTVPNKVTADPITTALVAAGVTTASIEQLEKDYGALAARTEPIQDENEYEIIKRAQLAHRDIRTAVVGALKAERDEAIRWQKFVLQEEKRILAIIAKTEDPLKKLREDYDNRELLRQQEVARKWAERMNLRKQAAFDVGYYFNGQAYLLDRENGEAPWVLLEDQIAGMAMSDEALYTLLEAQAAELKMTREIKAEAEAKAEEERLAKEAQQKAEADRIAAAQAELERKQREMEEKERQMALRILKARTDEVVAAGGFDHPDGTLGFGAYTKTQPEIVAMREEDFVVFVAEVKNRRMTWAAEEAARKEREEAERQEREKKLQEEAAARAVEQERLRVAKEAEAKKKQEELLVQQEQERIAAQGDKGRILHIVDQLNEVIQNLPHMNSAVGQHLLKTLNKQLGDIVRMLDNASKDI